MTEEKYYQEWFKKAEQDLKAAKILLEFDDMYDTVAFHCQQAAEKYLKGYLIYQGTSIRKTHDLTVLCKMCAVYDEGFMNFFDDCKFLTVFYNEVRYPLYEVNEKVTKNEAEKAFDVANKIKEFILDQVK
ncbi:hypothetical protein O163_12500 [Caldanaerobacter subterraneus subsp. yonseiensis KB-1]|uniref:HEPN domain-containing protein n=1 Tax=Caldanaerobacter subterraneus subsp. yonseiensis KB-1 TaxID=1388761 RepID=U5CM55_CALSX|nr:HEPN domain-containing protein [Caldanaerobacter subterraneus]ERM91093.1 hypothetical protein O163_12500 [Caldanaerobacter subterraneus subsp. yonseiensis KB-1]